MTKMAVLVGCNYPNTKNELHGCVNDVLAMKQVLIKKLGFDINHIQILTDDDDDDDDSSSNVMPTGVNIKAALDRMVDKAVAGDVMFFHFSGHGTRIPSLKRAWPFRQDEAIVPCDFNLITDIDFRLLISRVPNQATFTILSDSCHSGGLIDKEKEQIGPTTSLQTVTTKPSSKPNRVNRTIRFESILQHLTTLTTINTSDIATHLLQLFGDQTSLKFRLSPFELDSLVESFKPKHEKGDNDEGILLSGCQANETCADMNPNSSGSKKKAYGAFSNAVEIVLKENSYSALSNREVLVRTRKVLEEQGIQRQHPCLYSSDHNAHAIFLG